MRSTLTPLSNIEAGETLTLQVFGETEQFKVLALETASTQPNKVVTKETKITILAAEEDEESSSIADDGQDLERLMKTMTLKERVVSFGGFKHQRELLEEVINLKLMKESQQKVKIKGVLLHGPSGIGKTSAIEAVLRQYDKLHKLILTPKHLVQAQGGMLQKLQEVFKLAKLRQPSVLVLEEIDFIAAGKQSNKELFYTLLSELDSIDESLHNLLIIATTNRMDDVDKSLRRGGRLDIDIRFDMPSSDDRFDILKVHL